MNNVPSLDGPRDHVIPVARRLPVGRLEWAQAGPYLYGVDRIGQVFRIDPVVEAKPGPVLRLVRALVGL